MSYYLNQPDYCHVCGKKTIDEWGGGYNSKTGEKWYRKVCPDNPCEHHGHVWTDLNTPLWRQFLGAPNEKCKRCGKEAYNSYGDGLA